MASMLRSFIASIGAAAFLIVVHAGPARAADGETIGRVKTVQGAAYLVRAGNQIAADVGSTLQAGDSVKTAGDSAMGIAFRDNTTLSVGPESEMTIDDFAFEPKDEKLAFSAALAQGTFVFLTGQIAALRPDAMKVSTPGGQIGIRGTRFAVKVVK